VAQTTAEPELPGKEMAVEKAKTWVGQTGVLAAAAAALARLVRTQISAEATEVTDFHLHCLGPRQLTRAVVAAGRQELALAATAGPAAAEQVPGREPL
jgi:hypothetical protein